MGVKLETVQTMGVGWPARVEACFLLAEISTLALPDTLSRNGTGLKLADASGPGEAATNTEASSKMRSCYLPNGNVCLSAASNLTQD